MHQEKPKVQADAPAAVTFVLDGGALLQRNPMGKKIIMGMNL